MILERVVTRGLQLKRIESKEKHVKHISFRRGDEYATPNRVKYGKTLCAFGGAFAMSCEANTPVLLEDKLKVRT